jgi:hypothetical protein
MEIKIEKNVPMPTRSRIPDLPFAEMEIGDSFLAPVRADQTRLIASLRQRVVRYQHTCPEKRFSVVTDGDQMRVFRIV